MKVGDHSGVAGAALELTLGVDFTVNLEEGTVTFAVAPTGQVTGGCEFDVPVRFSEETDRAFLVSLAPSGAMDVGDLPEIRCVEDVDPVTVSQDFPYGGFKDHGDIAANVNITELDGRVQRFAPTTAGKKGILPLFTDLPLGGPYFFLTNDGTQSLAIESSTGTAVVTIAAGGRSIIVLGLTSLGARAWQAF